MVEKQGKDVVLKKGKTIYDFIGNLPKLGISIEEMREKAIEEAAKERGYVAV